MTTEEKAKAYDKAIEKIKYVMEHGVSPVLNKEDLQYIFPELAESEDERIRKKLIKYFQDLKGGWFGNISHDDILVWLEKQVPKPKWSENDEEELEIAIETLHESGQHSSAIWLKSLKKRMEE